MIAGPESRELQGISFNLAMAAKMGSNCKSKFEKMRSDENVNAAWQDILQQSAALMIDVKGSD